MGEKEEMGRRSRCRRRERRGGGGEGGYEEGGDEEGCGICEVFARVL